MVTNVEIINNILVETTDENTTITKPFLLNVKEIEEQIESIEYTGVNRPRNSFVEKINFPPMALAFYNFLFQNGKIPTENEFMETYEDLFSQHIIFNYNRKSVDINYANRDTHIFWAEYYRGRLLRTYPSFIREIHFFAF